MSYRTLSYLNILVHKVQHKDVHCNKVHTMWNGRSPCGAESVAERRSSHSWTSWLALDEENHWRSTPAVAPDGWVQWALQNPSICCSQSPLDDAAQNDLGIKSSQAAPIKLFVEPNLAWLQWLHDRHFIHIVLVYRSQNFLCHSISRSVPFQRWGLHDGFCCTWTWTLRYLLLGPNNWYLKVHRNSASCQDRVSAVQPCAIYHDNV